MSDDTATAAAAAPSQEEQVKTTESVAAPTTEQTSAPAEAKLPSPDSASEKKNEAEKPKVEEEKAKSEQDKPKSEKSNGDNNSNGKREYNGKRDNRPYNRHNNNVKTKFEDLPESKDPDEIRKQAEFYFSDSNLPGDKYLYQLVGGPQNKPVPISIIASFKRMQRFKPFSAVVAALEDSEILEVVNTHEVKRKVPIAITASYDLDPRAQLMAENDVAQPRSIYAKGFGEEGPKTQFDIEALFEPFGPIKAVRLRRASDKVFKGSVFVEFADESLMQTFLALETKPKWNGQDLKIMTKKDYCLAKLKDIDEGRVQANVNKPAYYKKHNDGDWKSGRKDFQRSDEFRGRGGRGGRGRGRGGDRRGGRDGDRRGGRDNRDGRNGRNGRRDRSRSPRGPKLDAQ
ncbi:uncharacterized protein BDZ99DRAFT_373863 [Mytilinidion resinicola]|uniref:RNA-binding La domain-containing protein n=1 Tax=Mytilinidion resinicola TaxID=574789 RepID=A0A6A6Z9L6_9PEZI|nr:uncharacterized protein BDZ99DRAFT_373863 [Mytilinidion resinicola]KAF2816907.1 hypothetical protein BDZ99DRAFT_373863 [Mytilinidion resinicola]